MNLPSDPQGDPDALDIAAVPELVSALERLSRNFDLLLAGKPVRDVCETKAEVEAALAKARGRATPSSNTQEIEP